MRRVLLGCALILSVAIAPLAPAGARPQARDRAPARPMLADRDGDRLDDVLERRFRQAGPGARQAVVVATDGSVTLAESHRLAGAFPVSRRLGIIHGFAGRLTAGQARALAGIAGVLRIDHDAVVRATMDAARHDYGVDAARAAYPGLTGVGVNVCILDTGVDAAHEQLDSKAIVWKDFVSGTTTPSDPHGHGTHVASMSTGDGVGGASAARYAGVAPDAGLWAGRVLDAQGSGSESGIIAGIDWCATDPAVDVISMSLGTQNPSNGTDNLSLAANNAVTTHHKVVTAAAGNSGDSPNSIGSPGAAADVITVGAASSWSAPLGGANHSDGIFLAYFSSRGGSETADKPDIVAPGVRVTAAQANSGGTGYATYSGTSMATPFTAGAAALALQAAPSWTPQQVQTAMEATAEDYGPGGKDPDWGAGLLDVLGLVADAKGGSASNTFPTHAHLTGTVPNGGEWTRTFQVAADDLDVPIAATVIIDGQCQFYFPGWGCLDSEWSPDLDAALYDPNGTQIALSQCVAGTECSLGRQETLHAMPTVAGTYRIRVYAYLGSPNDGLGGTFGLDLSTGPVGTAAPPPSPPPPTPIHVSSLVGGSVKVSSTTWRATVTISVGNDATPPAPVSGVVVSGRWDTGATVTCTTDGGGSCALSRNLKKNKSSTQFTVLGLSKTDCVYDSTQNVATTITVNRP